MCGHARLALLQLAEVGDHQIKVLPPDTLHGIEMRFSVHAHLKDGHDVGVMQPSGRARFSLESLQIVRLVRWSGVEHFQGHPPTHGEVFGFVNHAHAAATQFADDAVLTHFGGRGSRQCWRILPVVRGKVFQHRKRAKHVADFVSQIGMSGRVVVDRWSLAVAQTRQILFRQSIHKARIGGRSRRTFRCGRVVWHYPSPTCCSSDFSFLSARMKRLLAAEGCRFRTFAVS